MISFTTILFWLYAIFIFIIKANMAELLMHYYAFHKFYVDIKIENSGRDIYNRI